MLLEGFDGNGAMFFIRQKGRRYTLHPPTKSLAGDYRLDGLSHFFLSSWLRSEFSRLPWLDSLGYIKLLGQFRIFVIAVERDATGRQSISRGGGAIAESPAD